MTPDPVVHLSDDGTSQSGCYSGSGEEKACKRSRSPLKMLMKDLHQM